MLRPPGTPPCGSQLTEIFGKTVTGQHCEATLVQHSNGDHDMVYGTPGGQNQRIFSNAGFCRFTTGSHPAGAKRQRRQWPPIRWRSGARPHCGGAARESPKVLGLAIPQELLLHANEVTE
jgi:hypothetical protein